LLIEFILDFLELSMAKMAIDLCFQFSLIEQILEFFGFNGGVSFGKSGEGIVDVGLDHCRGFCGCGIVFSVFSGSIEGVALSTVVARGVSRTL
jgi:hypothetical protein